MTDDEILSEENRMDLRTRIESDKTPPSTGYRSKGLTAGGFLFTAGWVGVHLLPDGTAGELAPTLDEQIDLICHYLEQVTLAAGTTKDRVVEVSAFIVPHEREDEIRARVIQYLGFEPALFNVKRIEGVAREGMLELDWIALLPDAPYSVAEAAAILHPFAEGDGMVRSGPFVMLNGVTVSGPSLREATFEIMEQADQQLRAAGSSLRDVVKMNVLHHDNETYPEFNQATRDVFATFEPPTRSVVRAPTALRDKLLRIDYLALARG